MLLLFELCLLFLFSPLLSHSHTQGVSLALQHLPFLSYRTISLHCLYVLRWFPYSRSLLLFANLLWLLFLYRWFHFISFSCIQYYQARSAHCTHIISIEITIYCAMCEFKRQQHTHIFLLFFPDEMPIIFVLFNFAWALNGKMMTDWFA